jgi:hypothetical protein
MYYLRLHVLMRAMHGEDSLSMVMRLASLKPASTSGNLLYRNTLIGNKSIFGRIRYFQEYHIATVAFPQLSHPFLFVACAQQRRRSYVCTHS